MKLLAFAPLAAAVATVPQTVSYDGHKVFRVPVHDDVHRHRVRPIVEPAHGEEEVDREVAVLEPTAELDLVRVVEQGAGGGFLALGSS